MLRRRRGLAAVLAALPLCLAAASFAQAPVAPAPDGARREILCEFTYTPHAADPEASAPFLAAGVTPPEPAKPAPDGDLVTMEAYTVRDSTRMETLRADLSAQKARALTSFEMKQLGVGLHVVSASNLHLFVGTIFYIPFVVGAGVSW
jgi:glucose/arabinose dehydrogenase